LLRRAVVGGLGTGSGVIVLSTPTGGVKVFLEVGPTPVLQEPPRSDPQKLRRRLPYVVNKESGWPEPGKQSPKAAGIVDVLKLLLLRLNVEEMQSQSE
jgi:hypothetical protein